MLRFENIGVRYGRGPEVLKDVSLDLDPGSFHFLTGPSGAGKSSVLRLMYLALRPSRGLVYLFGKDIAMTDRRALADLRRRIGVVFQEYCLIDHMSIVDNVALPLKVAGEDQRLATSHAKELLTWVGLADHFTSRPMTLSGGQQQRVAIARAVINKPKLLLADEPTGNVDDEMGLRLMRLFVELNKMGTTVVVASHNQTLIRKFDFPILRLEEGELTVGSGEKIG